MADRPTQVKIAVNVDKNSVTSSNALLRQFAAEQNRQQRITLRQQLSNETAVAKASVRQSEERNKARIRESALAARESAKTSKVEIAAQTVITRETIKQNQLRERVAQQETRTRQTEIAKQKRDVDAQAKYEFLSGQKSTQEYIGFLKQREAAETQSAKRVQLIQQRQRVEARQRPSVSGAIGQAAISGVSAYGSAAAVKADLDMANRLANLASDLVEARDKNKRIFGEAAKDVDDWAKHADKTLGLSQTKALEAASTIGNLLHAGGITGKAGADLSVRLTQRAADIGSLNNIDPDVVADKIKSALSGSIRPLRELGIFISDDRIKAEALAAGLVKPVKDAPKIKQAYEAVQISVAKLNEANAKYGKGSIEAAQASLSHEKAEGALSKALSGHVGNLTDAVKIQARANIIFKDSALQAGNFAATSTEAANAQRIFNAELENAEIALGQKFLPLKKEVLSFLNGMLDKFNSLDDATKNFAVTTAAIGGVAIPLAAGVTNIVVQLLRIKSAYDAIKAAQAAAALSTGASAAAGAGAGVVGRFAAGAAAGIGGGAVLAAPLIAGAYGAYKINQQNEIVRNNAIKDAEIGGPQGIAQSLSDLRDRMATARQRIKQFGAGSRFAQPFEKELADAKQEEVRLQKTYNSQYKRVRVDALAKMGDAAPGAFGAFLAAHKGDKTANDAAAKALNAGNPGAAGGDLYSGAGRNAAQRQAESEAKKQEAAAKRIDTGSDKMATNFFLFVNQQAAKQKADTARFLKETQDLWDKGSKAIAEANYTEAKNALETSDDPKRIKELAKIVRDRIMEIYNAELSHLDAQFDRDIKPQAGESPMRRAAREQAVNARRNAGYDVANRTRNADLGQLDKQVLGADGRATQKAIQSREDFLRTEHTIIERRLKDADKEHNFEDAKRLINQRMLNEIDSARRDIFEGYLLGDKNKTAEGIEKFRAAQDNASVSLQDLADKVGARSAQFYQDYYGLDPAQQAIKDESNPTARGRDRFFQDANGQTRDKRKTDANGLPVKVDGAAIDALGGLVDAAKERGGDFFKSLIKGESGKDALRDMGKNLGQEFGDRAGDFLQRKLLDGPLDKLFDKWADKLETGITGGGKNAGASIGKAALALYDVSLLLGKGGKKKQKNAIFGAIVGGIAGSFAGNPLLGAEIGAGIAGSFAKGGYPQVGRNVLVGELGPELVQFKSAARIYPADQTAQIMRGGGMGMGMGGSTTDARQFNFNYQVGTINDRADSDMLYGRFTDDMSSLAAFGS